MVLKIFNLSALFVILLIGNLAKCQNIDNCPALLDSFAPLISSFQATISNFENQAIKDINDAYQSATDLVEYKSEIDNVLESLDISMENEKINFLQDIVKNINGIQLTDAQKYFIDHLNVDGLLTCFDKNLISNIVNNAYIGVYYLREF